MTTPSTDNDLAESIDARHRIQYLSENIQDYPKETAHTARIPVTVVWMGTFLFVLDRTSASHGMVAWAQGVEGQQQTKNSVLERVSDRPITPDEWHDVVYEVKGHDVRVAVDGVDVVTYRLPHVQPLQSFGLEVNGDKQSIGTAWFDEIALEALP